MDNLSRPRFLHPFHLFVNWTFGRSMKHMLRKYGSAIVLYTSIRTLYSASEIQLNLAKLISQQMVLQLQFLGFFFLHLSSPKLALYFLLYLCVEVSGNLHHIILTKISGNITRLSPLNIYGEIHSFCSKYSPVGRYYSKKCTEFHT